MGLLTVEEIDKYLLQIGTNSKYVALSRNGKEIHLTLHYPSAELRWKAEFLYEQEFSRAVGDGLMKSEDLEGLMKARGVFTDEDEARLAKLEGQLVAQKTLLSKLKNVKANKDRVAGVIKDLYDQVNEIKFKKYSKMSMSAEAKASEVKHSFLCWSCCDDFYGSLLWNSYEDYLEDNDTDFKTNLLHEFLDFNSGLTQEIIRALARSNVWRARYIHSVKTSESLFGRPVSNYTLDQVGLVYWSNYYQQIYEMMPDDRPDDDTIENDAALDEYMNKLYKDRASEIQARRLNNLNKGQMSAFDAEEVIVTKAHEMYEDIEYDKPREAAKVKDRADIKKRAAKKRRD